MVNPYRLNQRPIEEAKLDEVGHLMIDGECEHCHWSTEKLTYNWKVGTPCFITQTLHPYLDFMS